MGTVYSTDMESVLVGLYNWDYILSPFSRLLFLNFSQVNFLSFLAYQKYIKKRRGEKVLTKCKRKEIKEVQRHPRLIFFKVGAVFVSFVPLLKLKICYQEDLKFVFYCTKVIMKNRYESKDTREFWSLIIYVLSLIALFIYLYGFFPVKYSPKITQERRENSEEYIRPRIIDKLVFIIIDALRYDFVLPAEGKSNMPFLFSSITNNHSCFITTKASSPTVTLPRLKAITSGSISTYIDVFLNFMTSDFEEDNFINLATANGLKIVFYGDETWLKLFPKSFIRSEGTNSFYTLDYIEVDNNVTRHIDNEFQNSDWDIIILHYLGLDHIGHVEGPRSPLVKPKLLEMDAIIKKFHDYLQKLEENEGLKTMLIVTGDHGMKDSGSHGGVSYSEIMVPLVSVGNPCMHLIGWPEDHIPFQIDIAPTLSSLFGLPYPAGNMGKIIPNLLYGLSKKEVFKRLEVNKLEFEKFNYLLDNDFEINSTKNMLDNWLLKNENYKDIEKLNAEAYFQHLNQISHRLISSNSGFQMVYLISGIFFLWIFLIALLFQAMNKFPKPLSFTQKFFILGTILHALSLGSSSFIEEEHQTWYFFWATFIILLFLEPLHAKNMSINQKLKQCIPWIALAVAHRVLRKLNQTGDKWASLPDIKYYLNLDTGQIWLFLIFLMGISLVFTCAIKEGCSKLQLMSYGMSLVAVICYRIASRNFRLPFLTFYPSSRGFFEVLIFWISVFIFTAQSVCNKTSSYLVWLLLASLLFRPCNVILLPIEVYISKEISKLFHTPESFMWNNFAHSWVGNIFYFYQGNGNSISNVDVAAGFIGIGAYNPLFAGIMISAHTASSHILSFTLSPKSALVYSLIRLIPLTIYCTLLLFQLNHLFIWSVFSPKLLYEAFLTIIYALLLFATYIFRFWGV